MTWPTVLAKLAEVDLDEYAPKLKAEGFDSMDAFDVTDKDALSNIADDIGMKAGHKAKFMNKFYNVTAPQPQQMTGVAFGEVKPDAATPSAGSVLKCPVCDGEGKFDYCQYHTDNSVISKSDCYNSQTNEISSMWLPAQAINCPIGTAFCPVFCLFAVCGEEPMCKVCNGKGKMVYSAVDKKYVPKEDDSVTV